jgi:phage protein D
MSLLKPTFTLTLGSLQSSSDRPVGGPTHITVERDMDSPGDGFSLWLMERAGVATGDDIVLELGHDGSNQTVFTGTVVAVQPAITSVRVQGLGQLNALTTFHPSKFYANQTAGQIARDLIQQAGLTAGTVDTGPTLPRYGVDSRQSAYSHLRQLADRLGYELYGDRTGKVMFHALGDSANLDSGLGGLASLPLGQLSLAYGEHLLQARAAQRLAPVGKVTVGGESPMSRQGDPTAHLLAVPDNAPQGSAGRGAPERFLIDGMARTRDLADRLAAGVKARCDRTTHQIQVRLLGLPQIDLGDTLQTQTLPDDAINGSGYVRALRHRFGNGIGFTTDLTIVVGGSL